MARKGFLGRQEPPRGDEARPPVLVRRIERGVPLELDTGCDFEEALRYTAESEDRMTLTVFPRPDVEEIAEFATAWQLHPLLTEDLLQGGQRPKLERYGDVLFVAVRSARYLDAREEVEFSEFHLVMRSQNLAIICQDGRLVNGATIGPDVLRHADDADAPLGNGAPILDDHELLSLGPEAMLYRLLDAVVDGYRPVLDGLQVDLEQIERQVFSGDPAAAERIYRLSQEVIDVQHAATSLAKILLRLHEGASKYRIPAELQAYLQDVGDHLTRVNTETNELRELLAQILNVNATLVAQRQNEDMKKISGWAAILFAPTLIAAVYGMNFDIMPELHWVFGYPLAVGAMVAFAALLYFTFKRKKWM
ncbi:magnesium and cobalt transport protein CorA [Gulosibacter sp. 10]|uniref:magnesium and cobalt transport protein CorA n=1 Tax=Gulosibacter sp. 10 TaxID=1255570 RepID=UPI00097F1D92|nr:magnesium and cobalt transport protein CorA [Gulosibacter sp. 10]SJM51615.1 Magnesium and cobalt transport protein CorA [Gulosibacter sp. 10]